MNPDIIETLRSFAHDARVDVSILHRGTIRLDIVFPSRGDEHWSLKSDRVVHIDMSTMFYLGSTQFGGLELLSAQYVQERNFDYGGDADQYRVLRFTDDDDKTHILVIYGSETYQLEPGAASNL
jgi:hypothetical protein